MVELKFVMDNFLIKELSSGLQLEMVDNDTNTEAIGWLSGWFTLPNGHLVIQRFRVIESGTHTYQIAQGALAFWGRTVLDSELSSVEMSPEFGIQYLLPAAMQQHQGRLN